MELYCCSLSCLQFPEFSGNRAAFIPTAVKLQPSTMLGFINKRTAITLFLFSGGEGQEDKVNQRLYFKFNLKRVRATVSFLSHAQKPQTIFMYVWNFFSYGKVFNGV